MHRFNHWFALFARRTERITGHPLTFVIAVSVIVVWVLTGPIFGFSDTWQLVINTGTTIVTFLMVFLIQNSQNRDTGAIQTKLDELIRAMEGAHNALLDLEELDEAEIEHIRRDYRRLAAAARKAIEKGMKDTECAEMGKRMTNGSPAVRCVETHSRTRHTLQHYRLRCEIGWAGEEFFGVFEEGGDGVEAAFLQKLAGGHPGAAAGDDLFELEIAGDELGRDAAGGDEAGVGVWAGVRLQGGDAAHVFGGEEFQSGRAERCGELDFGGRRDAGRDGNAAFHGVLDDFGVRAGRHEKRRAGVDGAVGLFGGEDRARADEEVAAIGECADRFFGGGRAEGYFDDREAAFYERVAERVRRGRRGPSR